MVSHAGTELTSHQTPHGPVHDRPPYQDASLQVKGTICRRTEPDMGQLPHLQFGRGRSAPDIANQTHPLRAAARYMREKANHHLEFLQDINSLVPGFGSPTPSFSVRPTPGPSGLQNVVGDEDADGESDEEQSTNSVPVSLRRIELIDLSR
jgi:hypothetical protein